MPNGGSQMTRAKGRKQVKIQVREYTKKSGTKVGRTPRCRPFRFPWLLTRRSLTRHPEFFCVLLEKSTREPALRINSPLGQKERVDLRIGLPQVHQFHVASIRQIKRPVMLRSQLNQALDERVPLGAAFRGRGFVDVENRRESLFVWRIGEKGLGIVLDITDRHAEQIVTRNDTSARRPK